MTVLLIVIAAFALICLVRIGVELGYDDKGFTVKIYALFLKFTVFPQKEKKDNKKKTEKAEEKPAKEEKKKSGGALPPVRELIAPAAEALKKLRKKLRVDMLEIHYISAGSDPCGAALSYGRASAAAGAVLPMLDNFLKIKKYNVTTDVDFSGVQDTIIADVRISCALWEYVYIVWPLIKVIFLTSDKRKADDNGKTTDK